MLTPGETYTFKVTARNTVGDSLYSQELSILAAKLPDAPINLSNVPGITTSYQIGLIWENGPYDGGSPEIDYEVSYAELSSDTFTVYASGVQILSHIVTGLIPGTTYKFIVRSRNIVDFSLFSSQVDILAA